MDSNTGLFHDLLKAENDSLTEEDRKALKSDLREIFLESAHKDYVRTMLDLVNPNNVQRI